MQKDTVYHAAMRCRQFSPDHEVKSSWVSNTDEFVRNFLGSRLRNHLHLSWNLPTHIAFSSLDKVWYMPTQVGKNVNYIESLCTMQCEQTT